MFLNWENEKFLKFNNLENLKKLSNTLIVQVLWKKKIVNKIIEWFIFRYFNIRNFEIPEYDHFKFCITPLYAPISNSRKFLYLTSQEIIDPPFLCHETLLGVCLYHFFARGGEVLSALVTVRLLLISRWIRVLRDSI